MRYSFKKVAGGVRCSPCERPSRNSVCSCRSSDDDEIYWHIINNNITF